MHSQKEGWWHARKGGGALETRTYIRRTPSYHGGTAEATPVHECPRWKMCICRSAALRRTGTFLAILIASRYEMECAKTHRCTQMDPCELRRGYE